MDTGSWSKEHTLVRLFIDRLDLDSRHPAMFKINNLLWAMTVAMLLTPSSVHGGVLFAQQRSSEAETLAAANGTFNASTSAMHGHRLPICVDHPTWTGQGIRNEHCEVVTRVLYDRYKDYFWRYYRFATRDTTPQKVGPEDIVRTPFKVSYSMCLPKTKAMNSL